jgi:hypothetical protein
MRKSHRVSSDTIGTVVVLIGMLVACYLIIRGLDGCLPMIGSVVEPDSQCKPWDVWCGRL